MAVLHNLTTAAVAAVALACCLLLTLTAPLQPCHAFNHSATAAAIASELQNSHVVQHGRYTFFFLRDCAKYKLDSCFALNAGTPYGLTALPPAPGEAPYRGCITKTGVCGNGCNPSNDPSLDTKICIDGNMPIQWRLGSHEAIVLVGRSPLPAKYWSITSYVMSQWYKDHAGTQSPDLGFVEGMAVKCPSGPARCQKFASLGTPFNYLTLQRQNASATGFNEPFAIVLTASRSTYTAVAAAIRRASSELGPATLMPYPGANVLNMGVDNDQRDMMTMLMRVAYPNDPAAMQAYYDETPLSVLRVTPGAGPSAGLDDLYGEADMYYPPRGTGEREHVAGVLTAAQLEAGLEALEAAIQVAHGGHGHESAFMKPFFTTGLDCIKEGIECNGDCPDTLYPVSGNIYQGVACSIIPILPLLYSAALVVAALACCCFAAPRCCCMCCGRQGSDAATRGLCGAPGEAGAVCQRRLWWWCSQCCCGSRRRRGSTTDASGLKDDEEPLQKPVAPPSTSWCWASACSCCTRLPTRPGLWWASAGAVAVAAFLAVALSLMFTVWGSWCEWGHAATIDSGPRDFFVVYGVNHEATGHTTYASITLYNYARLAGIVSVSSQAGFPGSAALYLPPHHAAADVAPYLFAYRFARDCAAAGLTANGTLVPSRDFCFDVPSSGEASLPVDAQLMWIARMYVQPSTGTAPASNETDFASVMHFW